MPTPIFPLKSERARSVTTLTGSLAMLGIMAFDGVQYARLGNDDPIIPRSLSYDQPLPFANIPFNAPSALYNGVFPFPLYAIPVSNTTRVRGPILPQYKKPHYPKGG